jgi:DNA primase
MGLMDSLTKYQKEFIVSSGACVAMFNTLNGKPVSVVLRSLSQKGFVDISTSYCAYGFDLIDSDFKYGDWLLITEGIYDADSIRSVYKNSIAMLTSNITVMQAHILKSLTNRFIVAFDNDAAGDSGFEKTLKRLQGCDVHKLHIYGSDKDLGVMCEEGVNNEWYKVRRSYYSDEINHIIETY